MSHTRVLLKDDGTNSVFRTSSFSEEMFLVMGFEKKG